MSCIINGCVSHSGKKENDPVCVTFHRFPSNENFKNEWIRRVAKQDWKLSKHSRICSKHFTSNSFMPNTNVKWRRLKHNALPTLHLPILNSRFHRYSEGVLLTKMEFGPSTMEKLADLLRPPEPDVLQGEDLLSSEFEISSNRGQDPLIEQPKVPRTIEEYEEQEAKELEEFGKVGAGLGDRKTPDYTMNYQQSVSAEDVFLQIGPKTPGSASCENLIVRIKLPGDKKENVELSVDKTSVTVSSSQHLLKLVLPHEINPDRSSACWDSDLETLTLTLKLDREFDFVNF